MKQHKTSWNIMKYMFGVCANKCDDWDEFKVISNHLQYYTQFWAFVFENKVWKDQVAFTACHILDICWLPQLPLLHLWVRAAKAFIPCRTFVSTSLVMVDTQCQSWVSNAKSNLGLPIKPSRRKKQGTNESGSSSRHFPKSGNSSKSCTFPSHVFFLRSLLLVTSLWLAPLWHKKKVQKTSTPDTLAMLF